MRVAAILGSGSSGKQLKPFAHLWDALSQTGLLTTADGLDAILILGGDGTVHRHLPQLVALQLPVLVVPHGSGNDFARALGLMTVHDAVNALRQFAASGGTAVENVERIDLGVISPISSTGGKEPAERETPGRYFCCIGGIGLDAEVARRANLLPRALRRRGGYLLSLLLALTGFRPLDAKVEAFEDDGPTGLDIRHKGPVMLVAVANTPTYGGGIRIAPHARLDDGKLEVCVVGGMARGRLLRPFPLVRSGRHVEIPEVQYFQAKRLRIETEKSSEVYADGEFVCSTPVEITVQRGMLRVIVSPAQSRSSVTASKALPELPLPAG